jgi:hypothetical protein
VNSLPVEARVAIGLAVLAAVVLLLVALSRALDRLS